MNKIPQLATNLLLAGILAVLLMIWQRMPPTAGEFTAAKGNKEALAGLHAGQPVVRAIIPGTVDVEVMNSTLDVNIENTPIGVQIQR